MLILLVYVVVDNRNGPYTVVRCPIHFIRESSCLVLRTSDVTVIISSDVLKQFLYVTCVVLCREICTCFGIQSPSSQPFCTPEDQLERGCYW